MLGMPKQDSLLLNVYMFGNIYGMEYYIQRIAFLNHGNTYDHRSPPF